MVLQESCGVIGIYSDSKAVQKIYTGLKEIQHRGQEAAGIVTYSERFNIKKGLGLVSEVFRTEVDFEGLDGNYGIGQNRYSTTGKPVAENAQPILINHRGKTIALGHNGNVPNIDRIRNQLQKEGYRFNTTTDSEVLGVLLLEGESIEDGAKILSKELRGSYSLVVLTKDGVYGIRDPFGIMPLEIGKNENEFCIVSESCVFPTLHIEHVRSVEPGEIVYLDGNDIFSTKLPTRRHSRCGFQFVYFARPDSTIDDMPVYLTRLNLGRFVAQRDKESGVIPDLVSPVPYSGIMHEVGYQNESGVPHTELFLRKRYMTERTFIEPTDDRRLEKAERKFSPIPGIAQDKVVVLVDDTIVRGTTMKWLIKKVREECGAKEVHVRIMAPPLRYHCPFGIDIKTDEELIANGKDVEEIRCEIGADSLMYQTLEDLIKATGFSEEELCLGCWTGKYPALESKPIPSPIAG